MGIGWLGVRLQEGPIQADPKDGGGDGRGDDFGSLGILGFCRFLQATGGAVSPRLASPGQSSARVGAGGAVGEVRGCARTLPFTSRPLSSFKGPEPAAISIPGNPHAICDQPEP